VPGITHAANSNHCLTIETKSHWVGYRNNLHYAGLGEFLNSLSHSGFGETDGLSDFGIRLSAVVLKLLDNQL
jgi:hypothetical protein